MGKVAAFRATFCALLGSCCLPPPSGPDVRHIALLYVRHPPASLFYETVTVFRAHPVIQDNLASQNP